TKFVLGKALRLGLKPIVLINKVDRSDARPHQVHDEVFDLFSALDASDEQLDFPTLFASARQGWAAVSLEAERTDMTSLFDLILRHVPAPTIEADKPFRMLVTTLESDAFLGRMLTGRIHSGIIKPNTILKALSRDGSEIEQTRITKVLAFRGLERVALDQAEAGDIVAVAGFKSATVADTICDQSVDWALPAQPVDPPTLAMNFMVNDSPLAGREGDKLTTRMIRARLMREGEGNVAIRVRDTENADSYEVAGRGELQLGVLIETMRREGFELAVGRPRVLFQTDARTGQRLEPIEEVVIDVDDAFTGVVVEQISQRKGELQDMRPSGAGKTRVVFHAPSRGLIGYHGEFLTDTRGTGVMNRLFHSYGPFRGPIPGRRNGALIANAEGTAVAYALWNLEERGPMFIDPGATVYQGMLIGEHSRGNDLDVNVLKGKQLTNIRAAGKDEAVRLTPPRRMSLEQAIAYVEDDELVEVTPKSIRLRKRFLEPEDRKRARKQAAMAAE
ncbi:MAG TPA: EF-Tu/IF-2/RF-3 family GTPase, partial [Reyranella sp.]|nr:EF-Tu/IF-2/RF-3 family GTPase [Reyranella sp.]